MSSYRVGIIGGGFVGSAVAFGFSSGNNYDFNIKVYDIDPDKSTHTFEEVATQSDYIFVCVPTPPKPDMSIDLSYIESVIVGLKECIDPANQVIIVKSTVIPGTCQKLSRKYGLNIVSNPEFLTERRARWDFINATQIVIGSDDIIDRNRVKNLYQKRFSSMRFILTDTKTSEFIKYLLNCFFSSKLSFINEMRQIADTAGVDWPTAISGLVTDSRVADSHVSAPGPDGKFGYGGKCFPKDINAMIHFARSLEVEPLVLEASWEKNKEVRATEVFGGTKK